jgi:hypothetical protein
MRKQLRGRQGPALVSLLLILILTTACVAVPTPDTLSESRGLQPTEVNSLRVRQTLEVAGATTLAALAPTSLTVSGATALNGGLTVDTNVFTVADVSGNTAISGTLVANGGISVDSTAFTVADTSGNVATTGTLAVGGGYGSTGCSISAAGALSCDGAALLGSTLNVASTTLITGAVTIGNLLTVNANGDFDSISVAGNADLTTINNTGVNPITINDDLVVTGTLTLESSAFSGPLRFGSATAVVTGTTIAHGLTTTPTMAILTAGETITTPLFVLALNATNITVGVNDALTVALIYWIAGK